MDEPTDGEYDAVTDNEADYSVGRRTLLKFTGAATIVGGAVTTQTGTAQASTYGYGEGGYGMGEYGGWTTFAVTTDGTADISSSTATLSGSLEDIGGAESSDCQFEWRQVGDSTWNVTAEQTLTSTGSFDAKLDGLTESTEYEFRAAATASDGAADLGSTVEFTTAPSNQGPAIDSFEVFEAGSPDPHAEITAEWGVSDPDGNLDTVVVQVFDDAQSLVDATSTEVGGYSVSGIDQVKIRHVDGETLHVELAVVDTYGASITQMKSIQE